MIGSRFTGFLKSLWEEEVWTFVKEKYQSEAVSNSCGHLGGRGIKENRNESVAKRKTDSYNTVSFNIIQKEIFAKAMPYLWLFLLDNHIYLKWV